jgi:ABC-type sugar transport system ATPase subunit
MPDPIIRLKDIHMYFGAIHALEGIDLDVFRHEVLALVGDNGAGKSTLVKVLSGVYQPTRGQIIFEGSRVTIPTPAIARKMGIETVYQDLALADNLSVARNIFLGRELVQRYAGLPLLNKRKMDQETAKLLDDLGIKIHDVKAPVETLSGGQRQTVAAARAVYWDSKVILLDEPTSALAVVERKRILDLARDLARQNIAVIVISHSLPDVFEVSDRIVVLYHGRKIGERITSETDSEEIVTLIMGGKRALQEKP